MAIKIDCSSLEWSKFKVEGDITNLDHLTLVAFRTQVWAIHQVIPLTWIKLTTTPTIKAELKFQDGREWEETRLDTSLNPPTNFSIVGPWKPSEFVNIRSLRDTITLLLNLNVTDLDIRPR